MYNNKLRVSMMVGPTISACGSAQCFRFVLVPMLHSKMVDEDSASCFALSLAGSGAVSQDEGSDGPPGLILSESESDNEDSGENRFALSDNEDTSSLCDRDSRSPNQTMI